MSPSNPLKILLLTDTAQWINNWKISLLPMPVRRTANKSLQWKREEMSSFCSGHNARDIPNSERNKLKHFCEIIIKGQRVGYFLCKSQVSPAPLLSWAEEKLPQIDKHRLTCNLLYQSELPSIWWTSFANEQTLQAGIFFLPLLPPPLPIFFCLTPTPSSNISLPQFSTVKYESKMAA